MTGMIKLQSARPPAAYEPANGFFDELFDADGTPRSHAPHSSPACGRR